MKLKTAIQISRNPGVFSERERGEAWATLRLEAQTMETKKGQTLRAHDLRMNARAITEYETATVQT